MNLQIVSDIHLEFEEYHLPDSGADLIILAGDTAPGTKGLEWALDRFDSTPVIYIVGNHEFYRHSHPKLVQQLKAAVEGTHVYVLENDSLELGGIRFLGCTLWTDFMLDGNATVSEMAAAGFMNDYRLITKSPSHSKLRPADTVAIHRSSVYWLEKQLQVNDRRTVVVTHHSPSRRSVPEHLKTSPINPAYASNLEKLILEYQPELWIHGHMHMPVDYRIGQTRIFSNPRGYPHQRDNGHNPGLVIRL
ncbi:MAG: metallophosphoesterase [Bacteroidota bacterium]